MKVMKKFKCHEEVLATPMTRQEYNEYRGWKLPDNENGADEGFLVEYLGGGESNHDSHKGHITWAPKDVFEDGNNCVETFTERMQLEFEELMDRVVRLYDFIAVDTRTYNTLPIEAQRALREQYVGMRQYALALGKRLNTEVMLNQVPPSKIDYPEIEAKLDKVEYAFDRLVGTTTTVCHAVLNGFTIGYGASGCLAEHDFDQATGEDIAMKNCKMDAVSKVWFAEGYAQKQGYRS